MSEWTANDIAERFEQALRTLRRLRVSHMKPMQYFDTWPEIIYTTWELMQQEKVQLRLGPPTARAIQEMEDTFDWIFWVTSEMERELIWMRAKRIDWKIICRHFGRSRSHLSDIRKRGLQRIADNLNQGKKP